MYDIREILDCKIQKKGIKLKALFEPNSDDYENHVMWGTLEANYADCEPQEEDNDDYENLVVEFARMKMIKRLCDAVSTLAGRSVQDLFPDYESQCAEEEDTSPAFVGDIDGKIHCDCDHSNYGSIGVYHAEDNPAYFGTGSKQFDLVCRDCNIDLSGTACKATRNAPNYICGTLYFKGKGRVDCREAACNKCYMEKNTVSPRKTRRRGVGRVLFGDI